MKIKALSNDRVALLSGHVFHLEAGKIYDVSDDIYHSFPLGVAVTVDASESLSNPPAGDPIDNPNLDIVSQVDAGDTGESIEDEVLRVIAEIESDPPKGAYTRKGVMKVNFVNRRLSRKVSAKTFRVYFEKYKRNK